MPSASSDSSWQEKPAKAGRAAGRTPVKRRRLLYREAPQSLTGGVKSAWASSRARSCRVRIVTDQKHKFRTLRKVPELLPQCSLRPSIDLYFGFGRLENQDLTIFPIRRGRARSHPQFRVPFHRRQATASLV